MSRDSAQSPTYGRQGYTVQSFGKSGLRFSKIVLLVFWTVFRDPVNSIEQSLVWVVDFTPPVNYDLRSSFIDWWGTPLRTREAKLNFTAIAVVHAYRLNEIVVFVTYA